MLPVAMIPLALLTGCLEYIKYDESVDLFASSACDDSGLLLADTVDTSGYGELLAAYVGGDGDGNAGLDYGALADDEEALDALDRFLADASCVDPHSGDLSFWMNSYNALVIRGVVDGLASDPDFRVDQDDFRFFRGPRHELAGLSLTLDELEHGVLRADEGRLTVSGSMRELHDGLWRGAGVDARLHMAINCAARSCPNLAAAPYGADDLDARLDAAATVFLDNPAKGAGPMGISSLFRPDWFGQDFENDAGSVRQFIELHRSDGLTGVDLDASLEYDWALNSLP